MLTFKIEPVDMVWNEVMILAHQHWAGTKTYRRHEPFNPSFERYKACDESGFFKLFTGRDRGQLVAYFGAYCSLSMHSQQLMLTEDTFFIAKDYRGGRNALRFLNHIIEQAKAWHVHEIMFSCEIDNETGIKGLLSYLDFNPVIVQYSRILTAPPVADSDATMTECSHVGNPAA